MKKISLVIFLFVFVKIAWASVIITEIMYAPNISENDGEWIELYNNETKEIDLSNCRINGYNFDDIVIEPFEYIVIARELIDGSDTDNESFECLYGNCDGYWNESDGNYRAIDGYFALSNKGGIINLTGENCSELVIYKLEIGALKNGRTLERNLKNNEWLESNVIGGTPGKENSIIFQNFVRIFVFINDTLPEIVNFSMSDDLEEDGIQIIPQKNRPLKINITLMDKNGFDDIDYVNVSLGKTRSKLVLVKNISATIAIFSGELLISEVKPGYKNLTIIIADDGRILSYNVTIKFLEVIAIDVSKELLNFGVVNPGESVIKNLTISNLGNVELNVNIRYELSKEIYRYLESPVESVVLAPNEEKTIIFRLITKEGCKEGRYYGRISFEYEIEE